MKINNLNTSDMIDLANDKTTKANKKAGYTPSVKDFPMLKYKDYGGKIKKYAEIEFDSYKDLGNKIYYILEIAKTACFENLKPQSTDTDAISEVLELVQRILPFEEFDLLDTLQDMVIEENANNEFLKIVNQ